MAKSLYICYFGVREPLDQMKATLYLRNRWRPLSSNGRETFDLENAGGERYRRVYARLLER